MKPVNTKLVKFTDHEVLEQIAKDIIVLLTEEPFYAYIAVKTKKVISRRVPVAGIAVIDGVITLYINPEGYMAYTKGERIFILKHEILHVLNIHYLRKRDKDHTLWNVATDIAINQLIEAPYAPIPVDVLRIEHYDLEPKLAAESYYQQLLKRNEIIEVPEDVLKGAMGRHLQNMECPACNGSGQESGDGGNQQSDGGQQDGDAQESGDGGNEQGNGGQGNSGEGNGDGDSGKGTQSSGGQGQHPGHGDGQPCSHCNGSGKKPGANGNMRAPGFKDLHPTWNDSTEMGDQLAEEIVRSMVSEALQKSRGTVPGEIKELVDEIMKSKINWRAVLRNFVAKRRNMTKKATWKKRNRRMGSDMMGYKKNRKVRVIVGIDTSGSVTAKELAMFNGEIQKIYQSGADITVIECDARIQSVYQYTKKVEPTFKGRGGTDFRPVFEIIEKGSVDGFDGKITEKPDAVIFLTDGWGPAPEKFGIATLWVLTPEGRRPYTNNSQQDVSWGASITLED